MHALIIISVCCCCYCCRRGPSGSIAFIYARITRTVLTFHSITSSFHSQVALNLVLNYEEGGENCLLHGDGESEKLLSEIVGASAIGESLVSRRLQNTVFSLVRLHGVIMFTLAFTTRYSPLATYSTLAFVTIYDCGLCIAKWGSATPTWKVFTITGPAPDSGGCTIYWFASRCRGEWSAIV